MSEEMPSWRSLASAASRSIKGYVQPRDTKRVFPPIRSGAQGQEGSQRQSWGQWAGQKIRSLGQNDERSNSGLERLALFPGWATRRYRPSPSKDLGEVPFDVEIFVSGFASRVSGTGFGTRSGRAVLRLAKSYAALPKLMETSETQGQGSEYPLVESSEDFPLPPDEMKDECDLRILNEQLRDLELNDESPETTESATSSLRSSGASIQSNSSVNMSSETPSTPLQQLHANLEARLHPLWSSALSSRIVRISVFSSDPSLYLSYTSPPLSGYPSDDENFAQCQPIATKDILTTADGSFQHKFSLTWEKMCVHPGMLHVAFGDPHTEHDLFVLAQLLPAPSRPSTPTSVRPAYYPPPPANTIPTVSTSVTVPLTHTTIRVISDIDDTVKMSNILDGARAAFHNVFVKDLGDNVIPGMGDWYTEMWRRGVRFHYVSNAPSGLLPVITQFMLISRLPPGSIKLKSYAGRSLFNGLLAAPAERKRAGVTDVLDSFPDAQFILVGDSGEEDLELYASLASERPHQVLAIFIRDASNKANVKPLDDPTGDQALRKGSGTGFGQELSPIPIPSPVKIGSPVNLKYALRRPSPRSVSDSPSPPRIMTRRPTRVRSYGEAPMNESGPPNGYFAPSLVPGSRITEEPGTLTPPSYPPPGFNGASSGYFSSTRPGSSRSSTRSSISPRQETLPQPMSESERRQRDLQMRVYRARRAIPENIPLRVFREPEECVEAGNILDKLRLGKRQT